MLSINNTIKEQNDSDAPKQYFNIYQIFLLIKTLELQLYGVEQRQEDTVMDTNLLLMQMDVLLLP